MESVLQYIKNIPLLFAKGSSVLVNALIVTMLMCVNNYASEIKSVFTPQEDMVHEYVNKTFKVETVMDLMKKSYNANEISIAILHNGVVAISDPNFHFLKFSVLFSVGKDAKSTTSVMA